MKVVIVGGGTAGWLTACHFESYNKVYEEDNSFDMHYEVVLVESPTVPIIGAGEGSTGLLADYIKKMSRIGITEIDFLHETQATLKLGINFKNWKGNGTSYYSPIAPTITTTNNIDLEMFTMKLENRAHDASLAGYLGTRGYSTFRKNHLQNIPAHSYHFDAHKVGQYLKKIAMKAGTEYIAEHIVSVVKDEMGYIKSVKLQSGEEITGDLFIDCSGFSRILVSKMDMGWDSYSDYLPVNSALPYLHQYEEDEQIMPETLAWAQNNGWMWQIPTQERYGCGYVYCDKFVDADTALQELKETTGRNIEPIRNLNFQVGSIKEFWKKNVVAIGLSSTFLEPLQATSIHTTILQIQSLTNYLNPRNKNSSRMELFANNYNNFVQGLVEEFRDLIQIHYMTDREDTPFWKFVKYELKKTETTKFVLDNSKHRTLSFLDFGMDHGQAGWGVWGWTLVGLDILQNDVIFEAIKKHAVKSHAKMIKEVMMSDFEKQTKTMLTNTELIKALRDRKINSETFNVNGELYGLGK